MIRLRLRPLIALTLLVAWSGSLSQGVHAAAELPRYTLTDLGASAVFDASDPACAVYARGAEGISASGLIAGQLWTDTRTVPAASSDSAEPKLSKLSSPGTGGEARDINDSGLVVGAIHRKTSDLACGDYRRSITPVVWNGDDRSELPTGEFEGGRVDAVNNAGEMAGVVSDVAGESAPAAWSDQKLILLPLPGDGFTGGNAYGINADGVMVGSCYQTDLNGFAVDQATIWSGGNASVLDTPEGASSTAYDVNDDGVAVGDVVLFTDAGETENAVTWRDGERAILELPEGSIGTAAYGINSHGDIAGSADTNDDIEAVVWLGGAVTYLRDLVDDTGDWTLVAAKDISDDGTIVGYGVLDGQVHGFVLTPKS